MDAQLRLEHDPARSAKRKMVVQKKSTRLNGWAGGFRADLFLAQHFMPERRFPFIQPTATNEGVC